MLLIFVVGFVTGFIVNRIRASSSKPIDWPDKWIYACEDTPKDRPISTIRPVFCSKNDCNEWVTVDREFSGYAYCDLHKKKCPPKPLHNPHK